MLWSPKGIHSRLRSTKPSALRCWLIKAASCTEASAASSRTEATSCRLSESALLLLRLLPESTCLLRLLPKAPHSGGGLQAESADLLLRLLTKATHLLRRLLAKDPSLWPCRRLAKAALLLLRLLAKSTRLLPESTTLRLLPEAGDWLLLRLTKTARCLRHTRLAKSALWLSRLAKSTRLLAEAADLLRRLLSKASCLRLLAECRLRWLGLLAKATRFALVETATKRVH